MQKFVTLALASVATAVKVSNMQVAPEEVAYVHMSHETLFWDYVAENGINWCRTDIKPAVRALSSSVYAEALEFYKSTHGELFGDCDNDHQCLVEGEAWVREMHDQHWDGLITSWCNQAQDAIELTKSYFQMGVQKTLTCEAEHPCCQVDLNEYDEVERQLYELSILQEELERKKITMINTCPDDELVLDDGGWTMTGSSVTTTSESVITTMTTSTETSTTAVEPNYTMPKPQMKVGDDEYWCAICEDSPHGNMPGYVHAANPTACYYSYGNNTAFTHDKWTLITSDVLTQTMPEVAQGFQSDYGEIFAGLVKTDEGMICGKAGGKNGNKIWWSWGDATEKWADADFWYINGWWNNHNTKPVPQGHFTINGKVTEVWAAICHVPNYGDIPGRVSVGTPTKCFYGWGSEQKNVPDYTIIYSDVLSSVPVGTAHGMQSNDQEVYSVLVQTEHGPLPSKGTVDAAWYTWSGKQTKITNKEDWQFIVGF